MRLSFLADRTNGRSRYWYSVASVICLSVRLSSVCNVKYCG